MPSSAPSVEPNMRVGYPGRDGAHSAAACDRLFPDAELVPLPTFHAVVEATSSGEIAFGVLPIESSLSGPVAETHDLLYGSPLAITAETVLAIRHLLVAIESVPLEEIRVVRSHPVALDQCRKLLAAMPWATAIAAPTTGDAAAQVAANGDPAEAAIASERAASLHGLSVIADDVGDHPEAYTRFVSIGNFVAARREREGVANGLLVRDGSPARRAASCDRAVRATPHRSPAARVATDPAGAVALPLRRGARRASARPDRARDPAGDPREHPAAPPVRLVPCRGARMSEHDVDRTVKELRDEIAAVDRAILADVNARIELVAKIRSYKADAGLPVRRSRPRARAHRGAGRRERRPALRGRAARAVHVPARPLEARGRQGLERGRRHRRGRALLEGGDVALVAERATDCVESLEQATCARRDPSRTRPRCPRGRRSSETRGRP